MKITKNQLRRIIKEELSKMRLVSETSARDRAALADGATPSIEELDVLIKKKRETIESLEGYRLMDPSIDDAIDAEMKTLNMLTRLSKKLRNEQKGQ